MTKPLTWLCTFEVKVDFPTTLTPREMESVVAQCLAVRLPALGYAGNCVVTLTATAGNASVFDMDGRGSVIRQDNPNDVGVLPAPVPEPVVLAPSPAAQPIPETRDPTNPGTIA